MPTIEGRESFFKSAEAAYEATTDDYELIVIRDEAACGPAWVQGAAKAKGEYLHFTADDLEPHSGWWQAACETIEHGFLPAPRILNTDGSLQSCGEWEQEQPTGTETEFSRIPFMRMDTWELIAPLVVPCLPSLQYYSDNIISFTARLLGIETGVHRGFEFTHHLADPGRGAGMTWENRMRHDFDLFEKYAQYATLLAQRST